MGSDENKVIVETKHKIKKKEGTSVD